MSELESARKRLYAFIALDVAALLVAVGAAVGAFVFNIEPLLWVFVAAVAAGFAVQIWLIASLRRANKGAR